MSFYKLAPEMLAVSPSGRKGVVWQTELNNRFFCCEVLQTAGKMLLLPQSCISTAQVIFHRFFFRKSMTEVSSFAVSLTALYLASKAEESARSINSLIVVFDRVLRRVHGLRTDASLDKRSALYKEWQGAVLGHELQVLQELGFVLTVDHPHHYALRLMDELQAYVAAAGVQDDAWKQVAQRTWNTINDSMRTTLCLRFAPRVVAAAALSVTCRFLQVPLPDARLAAAAGATAEDVEAVAGALAYLYSQKKVRYVPVDAADEKNEFNRMPSSTPVAQQQQQQQQYQQQSRKPSHQNPASSRPSSSSSSSSYGSVDKKTSLVEQMRAKYG
jgi:hypothetical protein